MNTASRGVLAAALIGATVAISVLTPDAVARQQPFVAVADQGDRASSSELSGRLVGVVAADQARGYDWSGTTSGAWLVLELELEARTEPTGIYAELRIDDRAWDASTRPGSDVLTDVFLAPGLPMRGAVLVEVPVDALDALAEHGGELRVRTGFSERLAGVLAFRIEAAAPESVTEYELASPERVR